MDLENEEKAADSQYHYEMAVNIVAEMVLDYLAHNTKELASEETVTEERSGGFGSTGYYGMCLINRVA